MLLRCSVLIEKGLRAGSQFCLLLTPYMLNENTKESTALKFLLKISIDPRCVTAFTHMSYKFNTSSIHFSPNATLSPETRRNDIIPPLLPSSGKLCHYNSNQMKRLKSVIGFLKIAGKNSS